MSSGNNGCRRKQPDSNIDREDELETDFIGKSNKVPIKENPEKNLADKRLDLIDAMQECISSSQGVERVFLMEVFSLEFKDGVDQDSESDLAAKITEISQVVTGGRYISAQEVQDLDDKLHQLKRLVLEKQTASSQALPSFSAEAPVPEKQGEAFPIARDELANALGSSDEVKSGEFAPEPDKEEILNLLKELIIALEDELKELQDDKEEKIAQANLNQTALDIYDKVSCFLKNPKYESDFNSRPVLKDKIMEVSEVVVEINQATAKRQLNQLKYWIQELITTLGEFQGLLSSQQKEADLMISREGTASVLSVRQESEIVLGVVNRANGAVTNEPPIAPLDTIDAQLRDEALVLSSKDVESVLNGAEGLTDDPSVIELVDRQDLSERDIKDQAEKAGLKISGTEGLETPTGDVDDSSSEATGPPEKEVASVTHVDFQEPSTSDIELPPFLEDLTFKEDTPEEIDIRLLMETDPEIRALRELSKDKSREGRAKRREHIRTFFNAYQKFDALYANPDTQRGYMDFREPHQIVVKLVEILSKMPRILSLHPIIRMLEMGMGIGNDAEYLFRNMPNLKEYVGIEGSKIPVQRARERLKALEKEPRKSPSATWKIEQNDFRVIAQEIGDRNLERAIKGEKPLPEDAYTHVVSISSIGHFELEEKDAVKAFTNVCNILIPTRGILVLALKTKDSASFKKDKLNRPIEMSDDRGWVACVHLKEKVIRSFLTQKKLVDQLSCAGFDMEDAIVDVHFEDSYDKPGQKEVFWSITVQPLKDLKEILKVRDKYKERKN